MLSFENDYAEGTHKQILERLLETNTQQMLGYGTDRYSARAAERIKVICQCPSAEVYFFMDTVQINKTVVNSLLRLNQAIIATNIDQNEIPEAWGLDFTGHKIIRLPQTAGKLSLETLHDYLENEQHQQLIAPGMVYLSQPTEYGTLYSLAELTAISKLCRQYQIPLYVGGARLGYGLMSPQNDVSLADLARLCDVFYIGGTRVGALCGEAVVFTKHNLPEDFTWLIKKHATLPVKSRLLGVQFDTFFGSDFLYFELGKKGIKAAEQLRRGLRIKNYQFYLDTPTNQLFIIMPKYQAQQLAQHIHFQVVKKLDETNVVVRFVTSWATKKEQVEELLAMM